MRSFLHEKIEELRGPLNAWYILAPESQSFLFLRVVSTGRFQIIIFMKKFGLSTKHPFEHGFLGYQVAIFEAGDIHLFLHVHYFGSSFVEFPGLLKKVG